MGNSVKAVTPIVIVVAGFLGLLIAGGLIQLSTTMYALSIIGLAVVMVGASIALRAAEVR
jgi:hypothetical protein